MSLPWENSLSVLEVLIIVCSNALPRGTLSTCLSDTPILGSGHVWLYSLDTVPTVKHVAAMSEVKKCNPWENRFYGRN